MTPLSFTVSADSATRAYQTASTLQGGGPADFGAALGRAIDGAIDTGHQADALAAAGIGGHAGVTEVVMALSKAELALQTTATVRDRMVQAYQDIMRMPI